MNLTNIKANKKAMKKIRKDKFSFERDIQKGYLKGIKVLSALILATATLATITALNPDYSVEANSGYEVITKDFKGNVLAVDDVEYDAAAAYKEGYEAGNQELENNPTSSIAGYIEFYNTGYNQGAIDIKNVLDSVNSKIDSSFETNGMPTEAIEKLESYKSKEEVISDLINSESKLTLDEMGESTDGLGTFVLDGMTTDQYDNMMSYENKDVTAVGDANFESYDIATFATYEEIEKTLFEYSKCDNVKLNIIGNSVENRNIYSIEVGTGDKVILFTGGIHSREPAGTSYIMKQISDILIDSETNAVTKSLLKEFKIVAVPCTNPDGRVILENNKNSILKANAAGTDLNRNFPSVNAGQYLFGNKLAGYVSEVPSEMYYAGKNLGSEPETQALIRLFEEYKKEIVIYQDYHQAGRIIYPVTYATSNETEGKTIAFTKEYIKFLEKDNNLKIDLGSESPELRGYREGGTTDFVGWLVEGAEFSSAYGRYCMPTEEGKVPLIFFDDSDDLEDLEIYNENFIACFTTEIGIHASKGLSDYALSLVANEYETTNIKESFNFMMSYAYKNIYGEDSYNDFVASADENDKKLSLGKEIKDSIETEKEIWNKLKINLSEETKEVEVEPITSLKK